MICQNCNAQVDDDLIFCTNCGERLSETKSEAQTVLMNDSVVTQKSLETPKKSSSNLKWLALIIALIAIPASIFGVYLLMNQSKNQPVSQNTNKPATPKPSPTRKDNTNQNVNAAVPNTNANTLNTNTNANAEKPRNKTEVMNERIEIAPKSHYARPFEVTEETAEIVGNVKILQGEKIGVFVYSQTMYDNHFPDSNYKIFGYDEGKNIEIRQTLVNEEYVFVLVNDGEKPVIVQANVSIK